MDKTTLDALVIKAQQGDSAAFTALFEESKNHIYYIGLKMLKDPAEAEDLVQDVFLTVYQKLPTLAQPAAYPGWLRSIAYNRCKDKLAKSKPVLWAGGEEDPFPEEQEEDADFLPEKALDDSYVSSAILALVDALPDPQRLVTLMFYYDGMPVAAIASTLGISQNTVKSRLSYARQKLKASFELEAEKGNRLFSAVPVLALALRREATQLSFPPLTAPAIAAKAASGSSKAGIAAKLKSLPTAAKLATGAIAAALVVTTAIALLPGGGGAGSTPPGGATGGGASQAAGSSANSGMEGGTGAASAAALSPYVTYANGAPLDPAAIPTFELYNDQPLTRPGGAQGPGSHLVLDNADHALTLYRLSQQSTFLLQTPGNITITVSPGLTSASRHESEAPPLWEENLTYGYVLRLAEQAAGEQTFTQLTITKPVPDHGFMLSVFIPEENGLEERKQALLDVWERCAIEEYEDPNVITYPLGMGRQQVYQLLGTTALSANGFLRMFSDMAAILPDGTPIPGSQLAGYESAAELSFVNLLALEEGYAVAAFTLHEEPFSYNEPAFSESAPLQNASGATIGTVALAAEQAEGVYHARFALNTGGMLTLELDLLPSGGEESPTLQTLRSAGTAITWEQVVALLECTQPVSYRTAYTLSDEARGELIAALNGYWGRGDTGAGVIIGKDGENNKCVFGIKEATEGHMGWIREVELIEPDLYHVSYYVLVDPWATEGPTLGQMRAESFILGTAELESGHITIDFPLWPIFSGDDYTR